MRRITVLGVAATVLILACCFCIEGAFHAFGLWKQAMSKLPMKEEAYARYDPLIGWNSIPNARVEKLYGKGTYVTINSQGIRGKREHAKKLRPGERRAICSGDSFTFGYGVNDEDAWCSRLEQKLSGLQTLNLGQGGYGIDQAYLRYQRDAAPFEHQLHVFAFIQTDFDRINKPFFGFEKARLSLREGKIIVSNVPIPRTTYDAPERTNRLLALKQAVRGLVSIRVLSRLTTAIRAPAALENDSEQYLLALAIFRELFADAQAKGREVVFVYIPTYDELERDSSGEFRGALAETLTQEGLRFIDLTPEFLKLSEPQRAEQFLMTSWGNYHLSISGNELVANSLARELKKLPIFR